MTKTILYVHTHMRLRKGEETGRTSSRIIIGTIYRYIIYSHTGHSPRRRHRQLYLAIVHLAYRIPRNEIIPKNTTTPVTIYTAGPVTSTSINNIINITS